MGCDLIIGGLCIDEGSGGGTGNLSGAVAIGTGSAVINPGYMLSPDGNRVLDVNNLPIFIEPPNFVTAVDDEFVLDINNKKILTEGSAAYSIGSITPLSTVVVSCLWVVVTARKDNYRDISVGGPSVKYGNRYGNGNVLSPGQSITIPSIDDLSKVFIHGYVTDAVIYTYGMSTSDYLGDTDGFAIADTDDTPIT